MPDNAVVLRTRTWAAVGYLLLLLVLRKRLLGPVFGSAVILALSAKFPTDSHFFMRSSRAILMRKRRGNCSADDFFWSSLSTTCTSGCASASLTGCSGRKRVPNTAQFRTRPVTIRRCTNQYKRNTKSCAWRRAIRGTQNPVHGGAP